MSSITLAELAFGAELSERPEEKGRISRLMLDIEVLPFHSETAWHYGAIRHGLHKAGMPIGQLDFLIAATALEHDLILVTHNIAEFKRVPNLRLEDWQKVPPPSSSKNPGTGV